MKDLLVWPVRLLGLAAMYLLWWTILGVGYVLIKIEMFFTGEK